MEYAFRAARSGQYWEEPALRALRLLIAATLLATPLALVATASPSGAQIPWEITGDADCNEDGTFTLFWEIESFIGFELDIVSAEVDGAAMGSVDFSPNPIPVDGIAEGSLGGVPGDTTGFAVLTVEFSGPKFSDTDVFEIELEGGCEAVTTTTTLAPTTTTAAPPAPVAPAVVARPAFTG
jgi:hypothetical protein